jgi:hypothetical protein
MIGIIHGRFVPCVRMQRGAGTPEPEEWRKSRNLSGLFGALDVGYRKDIVYWQDVHSLQTQLRSRVRVALKPPDECEVIKTPDEALDYFRLAADKRKVFVSYAGVDRPVAERLVNEMRIHFPTVFDYQDRGESLPPGSLWREKIKKDILEAQFGVLLISPAYLESGYCKWEKDLLVNAHIEKRTPLFPVLIDVQARDMPTGLESIQPARLRDDPTPEALALRLVQEMQEMPKRGGGSS